MIRWRYLVTRVLIVLAVLVIVRLGMGPVARWATIMGLQTATGAKVEIGSTHVMLFPPRVRYEDFRVADPRDNKELRDALRADLIELELDGDAMMHRRLVANRGRITGIQVGSSRETSGHFEPEEPSEDDIPSLSDGPGVMSQMIGGITDKLTDQVEQAADELETVRTSQDIKQRYEREYDDLAKRAKELETKIREFKSNAKAIENPLRDWDRIGTTVNLADETRAELKSIIASLETLPQRFQSDLAKLELAKQADLKRIDQFVPGDLSQSQNAGIDLVSHAVRDQITTIKQYWENGRTIANYTVVAPENERARGVDIDLLGQTRKPDILVRSCEIQGLMRAGGESYSLTGTVENMTPSPTLLDEPLRAELQLNGPQTVKVGYVRDRRSGSDVDRLTIHWPESEAPTMRMGDDKDAVVSINGGRREIWVQMRSEGDQVHGILACKQTGVKLGLDVDSKYETLAATDALRQSLSDVDMITIKAEFEGTWDHLAMKMDTNLGDILKNAASDAIAKQVEATKAKMVAKADKALLDQQQQLTTWFATKSASSQQLVAKADQLLADLGKDVLGGVDSSEVTIGRLNDLLRSRLR
ncbi:TIGR03545 family protein [Stieleria sp. JC731]|uniref:TIGR03545 family protein n=1 Tax=Pirellulaceae TaxID=2691357 RepID=UPI001E3E0D21|nr:TIGR03545 family protein [Stieleria sp. JC731]MCC9599983.1 TIGR03545 family protein [Stieleria sp. JC731]